MRNAAILLVRLRGTATEAAKNIVLAGVGRLVVWDSADVAAEDLGAGFFFREDDVGKKVRCFSCLGLVVEGYSAKGLVGVLGRSWARRADCAGVHL